MDVHMTHTPSGVPVGEIDRSMLGSRMHSWRDKCALESDHAYYCTLVRGHTGPHVAYGGATVCDVWTELDPRLAVSEGL